MPEGVQGDGFAVPLHIIISAVARWLHVVKTACLGLRSVRNYAIPFHNFYKIVPLHSVPHNQAKPTANPLPQAEKTNNV